MLYNRYFTTCFLNSYSTYIQNLYVQRKHNDFFLENKNTNKKCNFIAEVC